MESDFLGLVGVHPLDEFFPFLVIARKTVVFVDDDKLSARLHHPFHFIETRLDIGPEIDGLESRDEVEIVLLKRQFGHIGFLYLATTFRDSLGLLSSLLLFFFFSFSSEANILDR